MLFKFSKPGLVYFQDGNNHHIIEDLKHSCLVTIYKIVYVKYMQSVWAEEIYHPLLILIALIINTNITITTTI